MKKTHIIGLVVIAAMIGIVVSTAGDASQYVSFQEAFALASDGNDSKVHVVGELTKNETHEVVGIQYNPSLDPNYLAFNLVDNNNEVHKVVCYNPPASMKDFEKSEKVVVIGRASKQGGEFVASEILMKCPSKYEETKL
ncbi:cytochrome c maturation protein CcmE [Limibacter armeniacum]|uniref:cytochrome c maturation protein CcmE domain-containing protein n=1 Tax=Limibacter armeniacum TaxID=466084 RepID=UPI002FE5C3A5